MCNMVTVIDSPGGLEFRRYAHIPDWVSTHCSVIVRGLKAVLCTGRLTI